MKISFYTVADRVTPPAEITKPQQGETIMTHMKNTLVAIAACALAIEEVFRRAGFPENVFTTLLIGSRQVDSVIKNPHVKAVTLTGSTPAGQDVARKAGGGRGGVKGCWGRGGGGGGGWVGGGGGVVGGQVF